MTEEIIIAGFGGQGVLSMGKILAYSGVMQNKEVSWMPSYGPEMRGGTANCSVILSDTPVGSPIVSNPDVLFAMNLPSLEKYVDAVRPGGTIILDSTLIDEKVARTDVKVFYIPATKMANEIGAPTLANMIMVGKMIKETGAVKYDNLEVGLKKVIPAKHADMLETNLKAMKIGAEN